MGFGDVLKNLKKQEKKLGGQVAEKQAKFNVACREMMPELGAIHAKYGVDIAPIINYGPQGAIPMFMFIPQRSGPGEENEGVQPLIPQPMMNAPVQAQTPQE